MARLRRSDFRIWDHSKAVAWTKIRGAVGLRGRTIACSGAVIAWALKRANPRGTYALLERCDFASFVTAVSLIQREAATSAYRVPAVYTLRRIERCMPPRLRTEVEDQAWQKLMEARDRCHGGKDG